jgi:hypothetical protein
VTEVGENLHEAVAELVVTIRSTVMTEMAGIDCW